MVVYYYYTMMYYYNITMFCKRKSWLTIICEAVAVGACDDAAIPQKQVAWCEIEARGQEDDRGERTEDPLGEKNLVLRITQ